MKASLRRLALSLAAFLAAFPVSAQHAELLTTDELRVCADPSNLPFSNEARQGFENQIADVIGADLDIPLSYVWFPQTVGFVRNTLRARTCDLVMGVAAGDPIMDYTNAYYHTGYTIVSRKSDAITATTLGDPALADKRIGLIAATPPTDYVLRHGLITHMQVYTLSADTRAGNPVRKMIQDVVDGTIDVALVWGPQAGYAIKHDNLPLNAAFLQPEPDLPRLDYRIAMGVRTGEPEWRRRINQAIVRQRGKIDAILAQYGIPLLDEQNRPATAP